MNSMLQMPGWWERFWFRSGSARNLAAARIVFALQALWVLLSRDFAAISGLPLEYWSGVPARGQWRFLLFPGHPGTEQLLQGVAVAALVAAAIGVVPRAACLLAGLLLYHLAPLETIIWTHSAYTRGLTLSVLGLFVLGLAPCGDAWSLSARRRPRSREAWEYHWPQVLLQLLVAQVYFFAAWAKVVHVGSAWLSGEIIRQWLLVLSLDNQVAVFSTIGRWIVARPAVCQVIALGTIVFEMSFVLAVFWKRARVVLVSLALLFHIGVIFAMNIFWLNLPQLLVFVDWDGFARRLRRGPSHSPAADSVGLSASSEPL